MRPTAGAQCFDTLPLFATDDIIGAALIWSVINLWQTDATSPYQNIEASSRSL